MDQYNRLDEGVVLKKLYTELKKYGYVDLIEYGTDGLTIAEKEVLLLPHSLFFVDMAYRVLHTYLFAISAPKYDIKGVLTLDLNTYHILASTGFSEKFNIEIEMNFKEVIIRRQYGMRKVLKREFDPNRYILREGFPDFPTCPYGHTFKMLGYDIQEKTYVRLAPAILKEHSLHRVKYKE